MILIIERDIRKHEDSKFFMWFSDLWNGKKTWRIGVGNWSLSFYPDPGLHDFFRSAKTSEWIKNK